MGFFIPKIKKIQYTIKNRIRMSVIMLQEDLIATPKALWIKIFHDRMVLMCHDGSTIATEYAESNQVHFDSTYIIEHFKSAENVLQKLLLHIQLPWYDKSSIIFIQILEPLTLNTPQLIQQTYSELGYSAGNARLVRLYNHAGTTLDLQPLAKTIPLYKTILLVILVLSLILLGIVLLITI